MQNLNFLMSYVNLVVLGICLCLGYAFKKAFDWFDNKYIPLCMLVTGCIINMLTHYQAINAEVILSGMISGLASTGLHEMLRNLLDKSCKCKKE